MSPIRSCTARSSNSGEGNLVRRSASTASTSTSAIRTPSHWRLSRDSGDRADRVEVDGAGRAVPVDRAGDDQSEATHDGLVRDLVFLLLLAEEAHEVVDDQRRDTHRHVGDRDAARDEAKAAEREAERRERRDEKRRRRLGKLDVSLGLVAAVRQTERDL